MNWVAADLPARFGRGHSRRELFATDGSSAVWSMSPSTTIHRAGTNEVRTR